MHQAGERSWTVGLTRGAVVLLCVLASVVAAAAVQHSVVVGANDFQWSGARLLLQGRDPYQALFEGDRDAFAMSQFPNYAPLLYVLLLPLAVTSLAVAQQVWAALNLAMLLAAVVLLSRGVGLQRWGSVGFAALFMVSEPFCVVVEAGQQTALALLAALLSVKLANDVRAGGALGVMLVKYSFAPVALVALLRRRWTTLGTAVSLELGGLLTFCLLTGSGVLSTLVAPLRAAWMTQARGSADVLTLTHLLGGTGVLAFGLAAVAGALLAWYARRLLVGQDWVDALAAGSLISLIVFPHLFYDYCFLLPVAASAVRRTGWSRAVVIGVVAVLWYDWLLGHRLIVPYSLLGIMETCLLLQLALAVLVRSAEARTDADDDLRRDTRLAAASS